MITKKLLSSFFCLLLLASMSSHAASDLQDSPPAPIESAQKTKLQRIISGIGHTALLVPSTFLAGMGALCLSRPDNFKEFCDISGIMIVGFYGDYSAAEGINRAIKNNFQPATHNVSKTDLAKHAILSIASGRFLYLAFTEKSVSQKLFLSIPSLYALYQSGRVFHRAAQSNIDNLDSQ
jgi:hypothetical protein